MKVLSHLKNDMNWFCISLFFYYLNEVGIGRWNIYMMFQTKITLWKWIVPLNSI